MSLENNLTNIDVTVCPSCNTYRKALSKKLIRGRSIIDIVAATIYIACKDAGGSFSNGVDKKLDR